MRMEDKYIKSAIIGHAVGDALGVPAEFRSRAELTNNPVTEMRGYGTYMVPAGSWSDDTSMTLCALEAFTHEEFAMDTVMLNFGKWYYDNRFTPGGETFDVGNTCRLAIENYFDRHMDISHCGLSGERDNGNGSLMRIIPFALCAQKDIVLVENASTLTHAHRRSQIGCGIYAFIVWELINAQSKDAVHIGLRNAKKRYCREKEWKHYSRLDGIEKLHSYDIGSSGYIVDTLEATLWCLLTTDSYRECVLKAVNLGDDTDTVAAVAGGLAGLLYGYDSIPDEWKNQLLRRQWIEEMCEAAAIRMK